VTITQLNTKQHCCDYQLIPECDKTVIITAMVSLLTNVHAMQKLISQKM